MNLLSLENITKAYTERVLLDGASFFLQEGEKVGIIGINGTGKSTLLKLAAGLEEPDTGSCTKANHVVIRYLPQTPEFDDSCTVWEHVEKKISESTQWDMEGEAKSMLRTLGIVRLEQKISELSGGQRKRLALAEILMQPCDILVLDEPTNHLDHAMAAWLEDYLQCLRGSLIMVTHDRYFLDRTVNRIFAFEAGGVLRQYEGGYTDYALKAGESAQCNLSVQDGIISSAAGGTEGADTGSEAGGRAAYENYRANRERKLKFSYKEKQEYETIEQDILDLEEKLESLDAEMAANATNSKRLSELAAEREQTEADLEHKMERWEYLEELAEKIHAQG